MLTAAEISAYVPIEDYRDFTDSSKPISLARFLTSSRSSSIDGSLVLLFSKCQRRGPGTISVDVRGERISDVPRLIQTPPGASILWMIRR